MHYPTCKLRTAVGERVLISETKYLSVQGQEKTAYSVLVFSNKAAARLAEVAIC